MVEVSDLLHWEGIFGVLGGDAGSGHLGGRFGLDHGVEARGIWSSDDVVLGRVDGLMRALQVCLCLIDLH